MKQMRAGFQYVPDKSTQPAVGRTELGLVGLRKPSPYLSYGVAVLSVLAALAALALMNSDLRATADLPLLLFSVYLSFWYGGFGPGLLAALLSGLVFEYFYLTPYKTFALDASQVSHLLLYIVLASFIGTLAMARRRAIESLQLARDDLDRTNQRLQVEIVEHKQAEERIQRAAAYKDALLHVAQALNAQLDFATVLHRIGQETSRVMNVPIALVYFFDPKLDAFLIADAWGVPPEVWSQFKPTPRDFWEANFSPDHSLFIIQDADGGPALLNSEQVHALRVRTVVSAPITRDEQYIGSLTLATQDQPRVLDGGEIELLKGLAAQAGVAITNAQLFGSVNSQREQVRALNARLVEAEEAERRRIARELHDEIGQVLTAISADLQSLEPTADPAVHAEQVEGSLRLLDEALRQVRDLALDLRPALLDDLGLGAALEWYLDRQTQRSRLQAKLVVEPAELRLPPELETTLFRLAQIALTNVVRHAQANRVQVQMCQNDSRAELVVRDDGIGFDVAKALDRAVHGGTLGLISLQERAQLAGGEVEIHSAPGQGTEIRARFPLQ